jgi:hypothetical protein
MLRLMKRLVSMKTTKDGDAKNGDVSSNVEE